MATLLLTTVGGPWRQPRIAPVVCSVVWCEGVSVSGVGWMVRAELREESSAP